MEIKNAALQVALEQIDADSWEELCRAVPPELAATLQLSVERQGNVVVTRCLVNDSPLGNRALALGLGGNCTAGQVADLARDFQSRGLKNFALKVSPYAQPPELNEWLAAAGLVVRGEWMKVVRDNAPLAPPRSAFDIYCLRAEDAELFGEVSARGFGRPPAVGRWMAATVGWPRWRHYVAFVGGQPAGAAAIYIDGVHAWLGIGSTVPEFRCRGVQGALIRRRLADGLARGVQYFVSETASRNGSYDNLLRAGFQLAYARPNYGLPLADEAAAPH